VKARFKGKVRLQDLNPPQTYTIVGEGKGGIAGFAKGNAAITLTDVVEGTNLSYRAQAQIGGKIAQLGQRLVAGAAKKIADLFFANCAAALMQKQGIIAAPRKSPGLFLTSALSVRRLCHRLLELLAWNRK
jgi:carbon monoxide dehydrogenase subunit G